MARTAFAAPQIEPPVLLDVVEIAYPGGAERRGQVSVVLHLTVDAEGRVREAAVVEGGGEPFDTAARERALRLRYTPARRDGRPVAAKIAFRHVFIPPLAPVPGAERPLAPPATLKGSDRAAEPALVHPTQVAAPAEVVVRGVSQAERLRRSAEAVSVLETSQARREGSDLGSFVARAQGVSLRISGGLGSDFRLSLNGLTGDQVRFFLDGIPLDVAGFPLGITQTPLDLIDRVEIYRGVVPLRFGADALGGAVNLVSFGRDRRDPGTTARGGYQVGSFGTYRASASVRRVARSGLSAGGSVFLDCARNDYPIEPDVPDARGRLVPTKVHRFHDAYRSHGGMVGVGFVDQPWAQRLELRVFATRYDKELQHDTFMAVPYGEAAYGARTLGALIEWDRPPVLHVAGGSLRLDATASYSRKTTRFVDRSRDVYDWFGRRVYQRPEGSGELSRTATDRVLDEDAILGRLGASWVLVPEHVVRLAVAPTYVVRRGRERLIPPGQVDPLAAPSRLFSHVASLGYEAKGFGGRIQNELFAKDYFHHGSGTKVIPGIVSRALATSVHQFGVGDGLRFSLAEALILKTSYEYATRLPKPDELFGSGILVRPNLELRPETSHNANLGLLVEATPTVGRVRAEINLFYRGIRDLIVLIGDRNSLGYANVLSATSAGVEATASFVAEGEWLELGASGTFLDLRNSTSAGTFGDFAGNRIPNVPWLLATGQARLAKHGVLGARDELSLSWLARYVHEFFLGWESQGLRQLKSSVPSQLVHSAYLSYAVHTDLATTATFEVSNITDERVYDFYGVERPGRAFYFKGSVEY